MRIILEFPLVPEERSSSQKVREFTENNFASSKLELAEGVLSAGVYAYEEFIYFTSATTHKK